MGQGAWYARPDCGGTLTRTRPSGAATPPSAPNALKPARRVAARAGPKSSARILLQMKVVLLSDDNR